MNLLEVHVIQNIAPANLNRDDTGSPKDALFGGVRRARVSSQAQKRAVRQYFSHGKLDGLLAEQDLAIRTKRLVEEIVKFLQQRGRPEDQSRAVIKAALGGLGFAVEDQDRTQYLLFLGRREVTRCAEAINEHWDALAEAAGAGTKEEGDQKAKKKAARKAVPKEVSKVLSDALDGGKAVDLALFGRMLADRPDWSTDAAAQVAHALSTHRVDREFDFYTAVDDLNPKEETGAGMMGDIEFCSAGRYRYANVNLDQLADNLQGDRQLAARATEAFMRAFVLTLPSGKQNTFAAHNPPGFVAFMAQKDGMPRNLAAAFEKPQWWRDGKSLSGVSVEALLNTWRTFDRAFGLSEPQWVALLNLTDGEITYGQEHAVDTLEAAVKRVQEGVSSLLEVS